MNISPNAQMRLGVNVRLELTDKHGTILKTRETKNLVVAVGRDLVIEMLGGTVHAEPTHLALGTSSVTQTDSDTSLGAEQGRYIITRRRSFTSRIQYQLFLDTTQGNGYTYTEAGLFNVRAGVSKLFARTTFEGVVKDSSTNLTVSWDITLTSN